jgi:hypothetical protein
VILSGDSNVNMYIKGLMGTTNCMKCPGGGVVSYNIIGTNPSCNIEGHELSAP